MKKALLLASLILLVIGLALGIAIIHVDNVDFHLKLHEYMSLMGIGSIGTFLIGTVYPKY